MPVLGAGLCLTHGDPEGAARQPLHHSLSLLAAFPSSLPQVTSSTLQSSVGSYRDPCKGLGGHQWPECFTNLSPLVSTPTGLLGVLLHPSLSEPDRRAAPELGQCQHQGDLQQHLETGEIVHCAASRLIHSPSSAVGSCGELGGAQTSPQLERDGRAACKPPGVSLLSQFLPPAALRGCSSVCGHTQHCFVSSLPLFSHLCRCRSCSPR